MRNEFIQILHTYLPSTQGRFESHPQAQFIRQILPYQIAKETSLSSAYKVEGSAGI